MGNLLPKPPSIPQAAGEKWPGWVPDPEEVKSRLEEVETEAGEAKTAVEEHLSDYVLQIPFGGTSTNSGNAYSIATPTIDTLSEGMAVCFKCNADSTGATTLNWDGKGAKSIKKANGTDVTNLKNGGIYTLRYDGTNFILQGEGASGDATASDLLSGKTATVDAGEITGTMPNRGAVNITPGISTQAILEGYHNGDGIVQGSANLIASNIKSGVNIFGVVGTVIEGKRFSSGTESERPAGTYTVNLGWRPRIAVVNWTPGTQWSIMFKDVNGVIQSYSTISASGYSVSSITSTGFSFTVGTNPTALKWYAYEE